jgi:hypothetical protein
MKRLPLHTMKQLNFWPEDTHVFKLPAMTQPMKSFTAEDIFVPTTPHYSCKEPG